MRFGGGKAVVQLRESEFIREGFGTFIKFLSDVLTSSRMNSLPQVGTGAEKKVGIGLVGAAEGCEGDLRVNFEAQKALGVGD